METFINYAYGFVNYAFVIYELYMHLNLLGVCIYDEVLLLVETGKLTD